MKRYPTFSSKETMMFGKKFAERMVRRAAEHRADAATTRRHATVLALRGDLGAGKTTFVQGFFQGLGIKKKAPSPTFVIMRRHKMQKLPGEFKNIFHVDAYRLKNAKHLLALGFKEILSDPQNLILIEWPERATKILPSETMQLMFSHGKKENERTITVTRDTIEQ